MNTLLALSVRVLVGLPLLLLASSFALAEDRRPNEAEVREKFLGRLEEIRGALLNGTSTQRLATLDLLQRERIDLIFDETFLDAFAAAAGDPNAKVRQQVPVIVGQKWLWREGEQPAQAIELMLRLSKDSARDVRYNAHYYGLSVIRNRSEEVVERMVAMLMQDGIDNRDFRDRVLWGWRDDREMARRVLQKWIDGPEATRALFAFGLHRKFFGEAAKPTTPTMLDLLKKPNDEVASLLAFSPRPEWKVNNMDEFLDEVRRALPPEDAERLLWTNDEAPPFAIVERARVAPFKHSLQKHPRLEINVDVPMTVDNLVKLGEEGGFKPLKLKPREGPGAPKKKG